MYKISSYCKSYINYVLYYKIVLYCTIYDLQIACLSGSKSTRQAARSQNKCFFKPNFVCDQHAAYLVIISGVVLVDRIRVADTSWSLEVQYIGDLM